MKKCKWMPCPWCLDCNKADENGLVVAQSEDGEYAVIHPHCGAAGPSAMSARGAVRKWNWRTRKEAPDA